MASRTRELIRIARLTRQTTLNKDIISLEDSWIKTLEKQPIQNNRIMLPSQAFGDVIYNKALIFESVESNIIEWEVTCYVDEDDYMSVQFLEQDELNGYYATLSYMTLKGRL